MKFALILAIQFTGLEDLSGPGLEAQAGMNSLRCHHPGMPVKIWDMFQGFTPSFKERIFITWDKPKAYVTAGVLTLKGNELQES
ncbi:hypothetical protein [Adonisia turfae]|uniref:hypothetical protein n=1 Tax=Adonisia turfae TaxID=2950184 RepID=UPI002029AF0E|nr:hypothetical protein [Adonisia turfae]